MQKARVLLSYMGWPSLLAQSPAMNLGRPETREKEGTCLRPRGPPPHPNSLTSSSWGPQEQAWSASAHTGITKDVADTQEDFRS